MGAGSLPVAVDEHVTEQQVRRWSVALGLDLDQMEREGLVYQYRDSSGRPAVDLTPEGTRRLLHRVRGEEASQGNPCVALGAAIRSRRRELGLTQEEAAWWAGVDRTYFGGVERGERNLSYAKLVQFAAGLKIPLSQLIARAERPDTCSVSP